MANRQWYHASDEEWATGSEVVVNDPVTGQGFNMPLRVETPVPVEFAVFTITTPTGDWDPAIDAGLEILDSNLQTLGLDENSPTAFLSLENKIAILIRPEERAWYASVSEGTHPFAVQACALHVSAPSRPRVRCRFCKGTAKGLAAAIVAVAAHAVIPAAIVAAVAAFFAHASSAAVATGGTVGATAFITSVINEPAEDVARKLCVLVGLCP